MSFLTGTNTEVIAASSSFAATASFSTFQSIGTGSQAAYLPIGFFNTNSVGKTIKCVGDGVYSNTSTPTLQLGVSVNTTLGTSALATGWATGLLATASGVTNAWFHMDVEITCQAITESNTKTSSTGTTANLLGLGWVAFGLISTTSSTANGVAVIGNTAGATTTINVNAYSAQFVEFAGAWSASSASNSVSLVRSTIYGCN